MSEESGTRRHGMTVVADGVVVEKRIDLDSMPLPAISLQIASERSEPVDVTVVDEVPSGISPEHIAFHPEYDGDRWTVYGDGELVWRDTLAPGERRRTVYGVWLSDPRTIRSWLTPPTVDAVRRVADDLEPLVVDESFVGSQGDAFGDVKASVADTLPEDALIDDPTAPAATDIPAGDTADLEPPRRTEVQRVVASLDLVDAAPDHDRYYLVRVDVGRRGDAETTVLEELTNALSVLHADAERRGDDAQVFDVAISTNWQAERIVTALVDDPRIDGLLVTELTGAVERREEIEVRDPTDSGTRPTRVYPDPADYADAVFDAVAAAAADDPIVAPGVDAPTDEGAPEDPSDDAAAWDVDFDDGFDSFEPAEATAASEDDPADPAAGSSAGSEPAQGRTVDDDAAEQFGADGAPEQFGEDPFDEDPFDEEFAPEDGFAAFEDPAVDSTDGSTAVDGDERVEVGGEEGSDADGDGHPDADGSVGRGDRDTNDEDMAAFASIQAHTERAGVDELDAALEGMELCPAESGESFTIQDLVEEYEDDDDGEISFA